MHLLFCINRQFVWMLIQCLLSISRFPCAGGYVAHILHSDLEMEDIAEIRRAVPSAKIAPSRVDSSFFKGFPVTERYPQQIYYRIFAAQLLPQDLERVLYLDTDTIAIRPLESLYCMAFDGSDYIACTHVSSFLSKVNGLRLGMQKDSPYINTGIMLMNLEQMRKSQSAEDVLAFVQEKKGILLLPDQDIISTLYGKKIKLVDSYIYNLSERILAIYNALHPEAIRDLDWVRENTRIIHYCGKNKPWNANYLGKLDVFYHELTRKIGPNRAN